MIDEVKYVCVTYFLLKSEIALLGSLPASSLLMRSCSDALVLAGLATSRALFMVFLHVLARTAHVSSDCVYARLNCFCQS